MPGGGPNDGSCNGGCDAGGCRGSWGRHGSNRPRGNRIFTIKWKTRTYSQFILLMIKPRNNLNFPPSRQSLRATNNNNNKTRRNGIVSFLFSHVRSHSHLWMLMSLSFLTRRNCEIIPRGAKSYGHPERCQILLKNLNSAVHFSQHQLCSHSFRLIFAGTLWLSALDHH